MNDMRTDAELLNTLLNEAPAVVDRRTGIGAVLSAKQLGHWTGLAVQTISGYRTGQVNIPVSFWQKILEHHLDRRIAALIMPSNVMFDLLPAVQEHAGRSKDFFTEAIESLGLHHEKSKYLAEILSDNRVDELDHSTVQEYHDAWDRHRQRDFELHAAILATYNRAMLAKESAR